MRTAAFLAVTRYSAEGDDHQQLEGTCRLHLRRLQPQQNEKQTISLRGSQFGGENCIMVRSILCTPHQIRLGWSDQGGWG